MALETLNRDEPRVAIGLHVALTAPFRPTSPGFLPLADARFMSLGRTVAHAFLRRFIRDALVREIAAQLNMFVQVFGRPPDYIDGHHHVQLLPQVRDAVLQVAKEQVPILWLRECGRAVRFAARLGDYKDFSSMPERKLPPPRRRAVCAPRLAGAYAFEDDADFAALFPRFLDGLPSGGLVMCHPGFVDDELRGLDSLTTLREREYAFLAGEMFAPVLAAQGVVLARPQSARPG
jgi:predicted glycoside hydrolase/deacetylase ChbG (UPF0249 family)